MFRCAALSKHGRLTRPALGALPRPLSTVRSLSERLNHPVPEALRDTLSDHNWQSYEERYAAIHRTTQSQWLVVQDVAKQRTHEQRYAWATILRQMFRTSPVAVGASIRHMAYTSALVLPYCAFQCRESVGALLGAEVPAAVLECLSNPQLEFAVHYLGAHQGSLISAFGVYSTALFLLLSMRLTSAVRYYTEGVAAFSELCAQASALTAHSQLYLTDKRVCTEICLWAYGACRATEVQMHKITGEEARGMYEHLLLRHHREPDGAREGGADLAQGGADLVQGGAAPAEGGCPPPEGGYAPPESAADAAAAERDAAAAEREASLAFLLGRAEQSWRVEGLVGARNQPAYALQQLTAMLRVAFDRGLITNIRALIAVHASVEKMVLAHAACVRVQVAPEPYSYTALMKTSSVLWAACVPLVLMPTLQLATVPMCAMLSFFVAKLDEISAELQNPYGYDVSDVGMGAINQRLQAEMAQSILLYNHLDRHAHHPSANHPSADDRGGGVLPPWGVSGRGNAMDAAIDSGEPGALKLGLPAVGDWADNEKLWKAAKLGGGKVVHAWPSSP